MDRVASRKYHVAPFHRQMKAIEALIRAGRFRNVTAFMRAAIDHYLDSLGRPPLAQQAREMAIEWENSGKSGRSDGDAIQAASMASDEDW